MIRVIAFFTLLALTAMPATADFKADYLAIVRKDKSVVEAIWPNNSGASFWVSMRGNGSSRDGFAEYLCLISKDAGAAPGTSFTISIWDAAAMARGDFEEIGSHYCDVKG